MVASPEYARPRTKDDPARVDVSKIDTLDEAARVFFSQRGVQEMIAFAGLMWFLRSLQGRPRVSDAVVAGGIAAFWPLQEWGAHKFLLHLKPTEARDPFFAQAHRAHHRDPRDLQRILLPPRVTRAAMPASYVLFRVAMPTKRMGLTATATYATMAVVYEWMHFWVHTGYRPKSTLGKRIRKNHHLHHYRNEAHWFGFTIPHVDAWLGTDPDPRDVPRSRTAMDLHGMNETDARAGRAPVG